jgi:hypothetical protein
MSAAVAIRSNGIEKATAAWAGAGSYAAMSSEAEAMRRRPRWKLRTRERVGCDQFELIKNST